MSLLNQFNLFLTEHSPSSQQVPVISIPAAIQEIHSLSVKYRPGIQAASIQPLLRLAHQALGSESVNIEERSELYAAVESWA